MTLLHEAVDSKKLDVRVVERNVQRGVIRAEDADRATHDLPDDAANADWVSIESLMQDDQQASSFNGVASSHH